MPAAGARTTRESGLDATRPVPTPLPAAARGATWLLTWVIAGGVLLIPFVLSHGDDPFRLPKELLLRVEVLLVIVVIAVAWAFGRLDLGSLDPRAPWVRLGALICAWVVVCALVSTNRLVSVAPTVRVLEYALLLAVTVAVLRGRPAWLAGIVVLPALVNAIVYTFQDLEIWSPFATSSTVEAHLRRTAFIGNPNDVGSYFVVPTVIAAALALSQRRWRAAWGAAAVLLAAAIVETQTVGAMLAIAAALPVLVALWLRSWRKTIVAVVVLAIVGVVAVAGYGPLRYRAKVMRGALANHDIELFTAGRTVPFAAAAQMARDHPLLGVGPGGFAFNFFDYKLRLQERYRWMFAKATGFNFGEVHNDHLQVAAETGLPGYALFLAALVLIALASRRRAGEGERSDLVRLLALPLALSLFVLGLTQFPLELAATTHLYVWGAAAVMAWRNGA